MTVACQERILLIEPEADVATVLQARLESAGYDVHVEAYGSAALSYAATQLMDLVILDVHLPDLNGYQVCQELRKLCTPSERSDVSVPILAFTAVEGPVDEIYALASGADGYLPAHGDSKELMGMVDRLLHQPEFVPTSRL
jgi:DNA-binding response OmpR family regulator